MSTSGVQDLMKAIVFGGGSDSGVQASRPVTNTESQESTVKEDQQYVKPGSMKEKDVKHMTEELNKAMERANSNLSFKYHKEVNMMSVAVVDKESGKVIKELPPEEMVNNMIKSKIWIGAFLDKIA